MTDLMGSMMTEEDFFQHMGTLSEDELEHYGVKGMRWGVLRDQAAAGDKGAAKKLAKADKKWQDSAKGTKAYIAVHNKAAQKMNDGLTEKFNANPKYKSIKDFSNFDDPKVQAYHKDYGRLFDKVFAETIKETYGESPSGRYRAEVKKDSAGNYYAEMVDSQAQHAMEGPLRFALKKDNEGRIVGVGAQIKDELQHDGMMSEDEFFEHMASLSDDELEHFGVKGMKWGKRKGSLKERWEGASNDRTSREKAYTKRVAEGKGSTWDKVKVLSRVSTGQLIVNKGLKNVAAKRVTKLEAREARASAGRKNVMDILTDLATISTTDLVIRRTDPA